MSCAAFTFLGVYAAAFEKNNQWIVRATAILGAVFFVVGAYEAWRDEHQNYIDELSKNQMPEIKGQVEITGSGATSSGYDANGDSCDTEVVLASCCATIGLLIPRYRTSSLTDHS
jgi:hypothetical protein